VVKVIIVHVEMSCDLPLEVTTAIFVGQFCLPGSTWIYTPCNKARAVYVVADVGAFYPYYKDGAGYHHFTSVRPNTLTQTFVLSARICLPYCVPLRVSNLMVIRQYHNDQHRALSVKLTAVKF